MPAKTKTKLTDPELVENYMAKLDHPLKVEIEAVRKIIKSNSKLSERIKWNAPSYYYKEDLVTFNLHNKKLVHLVFHHPAIVQIKSPILEGNYDTRRMTYFDGMDSVIKNSMELARTIDILVKKMDEL